jgi:hypothetical protein
MNEIYFIHTTVLENLLENFRASYLNMCALFNIKYCPRVPSFINFKFKGTFYRCNFILYE